MRIPAIMLFALGVVFVGSVGPMVAAPVPKHLMKELEGDQKKLQGKWKLQSLRMGDVELGGDLRNTIEMAMEFRGNTFTMTANIAPTNQFMKSTATIKFEDSKPKRMRVTHVKTVDRDGKAIEPNGQKEGAFGYTLDGDKLTLAANSDGKDKSTAADPAKPGPNTVIMVFVRVKE
ncbi:MAG: hypothetical protein L0241_18565 [Planctomycetia bacterium]|nr:hypothetical protein [Planctomycetia bacterium]